jgi:outer membrane protein assembly factor BamB
MPQENPSGISELRMTDPKDRGKNYWKNDLFQEIAAVAIAKNAIVVTGLNREKKNFEKITAGIAALDINTGKILWRQPLPATPTAWGLAIADGGNNIVVTLMDGRLMAFGK